MTCPVCRAEIPTGSAFCPACGNPSPTVITNERAAPSPAPTAVPTAERLARALGAKYQVKRLVGRGGFAEVYELWDQDLDRRLACKVLHPEIAWTPGMLTRFRQGAMTATGFTVGTVQYMSPEQALGQPNLDGRSDLYAFGAMLFQMVTGAPPYDGNSSAEIVGKHLTDPIPVASDVNARIPRWLSDTIVKCLAKQPDWRFQTADDVLATLARGRAAGSPKLVGAATVERQVRSSGEVRSRSRRLGWWVAGGLAGAAAGLLVARPAGLPWTGGAVVPNPLVAPAENFARGAPLVTERPEGGAP